MDDADLDSLEGMRSLLEVAKGVLADLDLPTVLQKLLESARALSGAQYAAIGVLDASRRELAEFVVSGIDAQTRERIGPMPRGRGVLGALIADPRPLRLPDVGDHPHSFGFPAGHPKMRSFLGVPIFIDDQPFGNLYLAEKRGADEFSAADEEALVLLAGFAGVAIDHARRFTRSETQRSDLQRTVQALDATVQIARALGGETNLDAVLELVAKRGRALVTARALVIEYVRGPEMVIAATAGEVPHDLIGQTVDIEDSLAASALRTMTTLRLEVEPNRLRFVQHGLGRLGFEATAGMVVPLSFKGQGYGALVALDRIEDGPEFTAEDQRLLESFATSAATAVATARSVEAEHRSQRLAAAEQERARWARELHDETLQNLAALRLSFAAQKRQPNPEAVPALMEEAIEQIDMEIQGLRALISELRPTALDDLGLEAALEDLANRARRRGLSVELSVELQATPASTRTKAGADVETALYRIAQEALTNAGKHGRAEHARIELRDDGTAITLTIGDDGIGFDPAARTSGFGLSGIRERVELLDGNLRVTSAPSQGTTIAVEIPNPSRPQRQAIAS